MSAGCYAYRRLPSAVQKEEERHLRYILMRQEKDKRMSERICPTMSSLKCWGVSHVPRSAACSFRQRAVKARCCMICGSSGASVCAQRDGSSTRMQPREWHQRVQGRSAYGCAQHAHQFPRPAYHRRHASPAFSQVARSSLASEGRWRRKRRCLPVAAKAPEMIPRE